MAYQIEDLYSFEPFNGGQSVRFTCSAGVATTPVGLPGSGDSSNPGKRVRVRIVNEGVCSALVALVGQPGPTNGMTMLPGTSETFTVPYSTNGVTFSAMGISGQTTVCATAGQGS